MTKKLLKAFLIVSVLFCVYYSVSAEEFDVTVKSATEENGKIVAVLEAKSDMCVTVIAADFSDDGTLKSAEIKTDVSLLAGVEKSSEISNPDAGIIYVWDNSQKPLCKAFEVTRPETTANPTNPPAGDGIIHLMDTYIDAEGVKNVTVDGTIVTINAAGEYTIDGTLTDGQIVVSDSLPKSDAVVINLNGVSVTSSDSAPFNGGGAKIELNITDECTFTDTQEYTSYTTTKAPKGCVYSKRDLTVGGTGTLKVKANVKNGIVCGADLKFKKSINIDVTALNNAIKGDNGVKFTSKAGTAKITAAEGDGIKSDAIDSDTGLLETDKGYVTIEGGDITINAPLGDGIQADNYCEISGGTVNITSGTEGIKANEVNVPASEGDEALENTFINGEIRITGGTVTVVSGEDGIKATKSVTISDTADVTVTANGIDESDNSGYDAIQAGKSEETVDGNTTTETVIVSGTVNILGGTLNILGASDDAIVSKGDLNIKDCVIRGKSTADFMKVYDNVKIESGEIDIEAGCDGIQAGKAMTVTIKDSNEEKSDYTAGNIKITGGDINIYTREGHGITLADEDESSKGIKANTDLTITGGNITIDSSDDSLHSNYNLTITGGNMNLASGDDGVHADYILTLGTDDGADDSHMIDVSYSYEGIEGSVIKILSGTQYLYATDDGINAAGDYSEDGVLSTQGDVVIMAGGSRPGFDMGMDHGRDDSAPYGKLYIKGGKTYVEAYGDGMDSNGDIEMSGGIAIINGPTNGGNGVFDKGDGNNNYFKVTGGTLIGVGTSDMPVNPTVTGQGYVLKSGSTGGSNRPGGTSSSGSAGTPVKIATDNGNIVIIPKVQWGYMFVTTPDMTSGNSYTLTTNASYTGGTQILGKTVNNIFYGLVENCD